MLVQNILDFEPRWLFTDEPLRYGMGASIGCPTHGKECRLEFWFAIPTDGEPPITKRKLWGRLGAKLVELTIYPLGFDHSRPLVVADHWSGWIDHGDVITPADDDIKTDPGTDPGIVT